MARSLLVAPAAEDVGLARTCLGLLRALDRAGVKIAFVKPVAQPRPDGGPDRSAALVAAVTPLRPQDPLTTADLEGQLGQDRMGKARLDVVLEKIVAAWEPIYAGSDVVVVEGLSSGPSKLYVSAVNQALARSLDAEVLLVGQWPPDAAVEPLAGQLAIASSGYASGEQGRVVGCVVHGLPPAEPRAIEQLTAELARRGLRLIAGVPYRPELTWPRVRDLVRELDPEILSEGDLTRRIRSVAVFAQGIPGGLPVLDDGRLIVVPGDRHEVIMAAYLTELGGTHLAALLLSAGIPPDRR
ncbi:MAG TPA: AAA family ATPase, partial [Streptosporangiaceae bacterium]|nr:AAA family ATPase [Streptosporangiaceae bacterium]